MYDGLGSIFVRQTLPEILLPKFHARQRRKIDIYYDKASNRLPKWTDDDRQHRRTTTIIQQSMSMRFYLRLLATRICKFHCHSCSTRGDIVTESFACQRYVTNQTDGTYLNDYSNLNIETTTVSLVSHDPAGRDFLTTFRTKESTYSNMRHTIVTALSRRGLPRIFDLL